MNFVFVNSCKENVIYPLTVRELAEAQSKDKMLEKLHFEKYKPQLVENIEVLCNVG